jgi:hypothetical protein
MIPTLPAVIISCCIVLARPIYPLIAILAVETDEFGHRGYDQKDEEIRYDDLFMIHSGKWIFIRFNPDDNISKVDIDDKLDKLIETMNECIDRIEREENVELVEIIKLYC